MMSPYDVMDAEDHVHVFSLFCILDNTKFGWCCCQFFETRCDDQVSYQFFGKHTIPFGALLRPAAHGSKAHDVVNSKVLLLFACWDTMAGVPSSSLQCWQTVLLLQDPLTLQCKWRNSLKDKNSSTGQSCCRDALALASIPPVEALTMTRPQSSQATAILVSEK